MANPINPILGTETINPRHLREKFKDWVGKRVIVGLTSYHYLCGVWVSTDDHNDVAFKIGDKEIKVSITEIDNVSDALQYQSDFYK